MQSAFLWEYLDNEGYMSENETDKQKMSIIAIFIHCVYLIQSLCPKAILKKITKSEGIASCL